MDVAQVFEEELERKGSPTQESRSWSPPPVPRAAAVTTSLATSPAEIAMRHAVEAAREEEESGKTEIARKEQEEEYTAPSVKNMVASWGPRSTEQTAATNNVPGANGANSATRRTTTATGNTITAPPIEKRKSSYDRYSAFIMPPLEEERTPVPSPVNTLKKEAATNPKELESGEEDEKPEVLAMGPDAEEVVKAVEAVEAKRPRDEVVHLGECARVSLCICPNARLAAHDDKPLPRVDVDALYRAPRARYTADSDLNTISVDVIAIDGATTTPINKDPHVFYDAELLAIVHRAKAKSSGLVSTRVWAWQGRRAQPGERERQKVHELARRYNTTPIAVEQAREPPELVALLGGTLATRQGTRAHWSAENTAMHLVRSLQGFVYIDELDLVCASPVLCDARFSNHRTVQGVQHLCSGYSYCVSILQTFYIWHGRGSVPAEQASARTYASSLAPSPDSVVEFTEEESEADPMFWAVLGEGDYARADYWRWRSEPAMDPRVWVVDTAQRDVVSSSFSLFGVCGLRDNVSSFPCRFVPRSASPRRPSLLAPCSSSTAYGNCLSLSVAMRGANAWISGSRFPWPKLLRRRRRHLGRSLPPFTRWSFPPRYLQTFS